MDPDSRAREKDAGLRDEMLPKVTEHLIKGDHVTNEDERRKIQAVIGKYDELLGQETETT